MTDPKTDPKPRASHPKITAALAAMVRHVCPESGPHNESDAAKAHEHLCAAMQPALAEADALVAEVNGLRARVAESQAILDVIDRATAATSPPRERWRSGCWRSSASATKR